MPALPARLRGLVKLPRRVTSIANDRGAVKDLILSTVGRHGLFPRRGRSGSDGSGSVLSDDTFGPTHRERDERKKSAGMTVAVALATGATMFALGALTCGLAMVAFRGKKKVADGK